MKQASLMRETLEPLKLQLRYNETSIFDA
jgi:hypothetical protein